MTTTLPLPDLIGEIAPNPQALADGARRMADVWCDRETDSLPLIFSALPPAGVVHNADMRLHFEDAEQMLYDACVGLVALARAGADGQLTLRADTGTGTLATIAGCEQVPMETALPWTNPVTREALATFAPETMDCGAAGIMPRVRELCASFRAQMPECVHLMCADTQGPFDLAHLLIGDEFFYLLYDDPAYIHALLEQATALYIAGTRVMKEWIGEPLDGGFHREIALAQGGVRVCEDTATLLSPALVEEFVLPYTERALAAFGGGFVHYCGHHETLLNGLLRSPWVRGINLGNPEHHDFATLLPRLMAAGKCYHGSIPREEAEPLTAYFTRVLGYTGGARKGLILQPCLWPEEQAEPERVLGTWRELQG